MDERRPPDEAGSTARGPAGGSARTHRPPTDEGRHDETRQYDTQPHETRHEAVHDERDDHDDRSGPLDHREREERRHEAFGGANLGAAFFGWLVAVALTILLAGILGAIAAAVGQQLDVSFTEAEDGSQTLGLGAAIALLVVLVIGYFAGGYVAGRMSRYDGGRQGLAVWVIGLVLTIVAAVVGLLFGREYDVLDRVDLPSIPVADDTLTVGGIVALAAVVLGTLLAAMVGGKAGHRYHTKVDRFAG